VRRDRRHRLEAARHLVLALRAALDQAQAQRDRRLDGLVVADFEVQARHVFERAPVAAVQPLLVVDQQAGGDRAAGALGQHQDQVLGQGAPDALEERLVEVGRGMVRRVGGLVAAGEERPARRRDVAAVQPAHVHLFLRHAATLGADLLALGLRERRQERLEVVVAVVAPVELHAVAQHQARLAQGGSLGLEREQHVQRGHARGARQRQQRVRRGPARPGVARPEAGARHGRERHRAQQLGVVAQAVALIGIGPGPVEHVLAPGMRLQVQRHRRHRRARCVSQQQVARGPAAARADAAGELERAQELVAQEGLRLRAARAGSRQRIPLRGRHARQIVEDLRAIIAS